MTRSGTGTRLYLAALAPGERKKHTYRSIEHTIAVSKRVRKRCVRNELYSDEDIDHEQPKDTNTCDCGCSREINRRLTLLLHRFFASKYRWLAILKIGKCRPSELERVSMVIEKHGHEVMGKDKLDLDTIQLDISRQQWLNEADDAHIVKQSLLTFCVVNNVGYWQGLHDVAAALVHLEPKPTVGELAAMVEKLVCTFASILMRATDEIIVNDATKIAAKWRLIFLFFFPKAATDLERLADSNSWNINWFLTMGFYRFGCAYLALAYAYAAIAASAGCMTAFMYHEMGYLGVRGYMTWRLAKKQDNALMTNNLFDDQIDDCTIAKAVTNSKMIQLTPDELINVSRNLYDTLNDVECEMADFPMIAILKMSNFFFNKSPLMLYKNNDVQSKNVVQIGIQDIFKTNNGQKSTETQSAQPQVITRWIRKRFRSPRPSEKISDAFNNALFRIYVKNLYANVIKKSFIFPSRFAGNTNAYNIIDVRSSYLKYGEPLDSFFGDMNVKYLTQGDLDDFLRGTNLDQTFTLWVIVTDDGYDNMTDSTSVESLDRGVDIYRILSRSCTGVAILKGGYKELLRWKNLPVPAKVNSFLKRVWDWMPTGRVQAPKIAIQNVVTAIDGALGDISDKITQEVVARIGAFKKRTVRIPCPSSNIASHASSRKTGCNGYVIHIAVGNKMYASFNSNGGIKLNGIVWHPKTIARFRSNFAASFMLFIASIFQVANTDGFLEVITESASVKGARSIVNRTISDFREGLDGNVLILSDNLQERYNVIPDVVLSTVVQITHTCVISLQSTTVRRLDIAIINGRAIIKALVQGEILMQTYINIATRITVADNDTNTDQEDDEPEETSHYARRGSEIVSVYNDPFDIQSELQHVVHTSRNDRTVERMITPIDLTRLKAYVSMPSMSIAAQEPSLYSERRVHVFSRRINPQPKISIESVIPTNHNKPSNAVKKIKHVFAPRRQLKKGQAKTNLNEHLQSHGSYYSL
ncbi:uncharacterized protein BXIN_2437 [Babesia sp. Xinjiang]|uniref:uncharacterized protein n=1 Tax=Babesia sp. Xinjiang TaxID=462227 RepID=UPI000A2552B2|nr:uncharacterized protein BXIN_2437 [Babesia sp. Xinjiang]ORM41449.1 hypothetical protein BXIN_2437 [Babesia sp. Xinjiang]